MNLDIENICRICLKHHDALKPIFGEDTRNKINNRICDEIKFCTSVEIVEDADLPSQICEGCLEALNVASDFKRLCKNSESRLAIHKKTYNIKKIHIPRNNDESNPQRELLGDESPEPLNVKEEFIEDEHSESDFSKFSDDDWNDTSGDTSIQDENEEEKRKSLVIRNIELLQMSIKQGSRSCHMCEICGKMFRSEYDLITHKGIHDSHRPFKCDLCTKRFIRETQLKTHMKNHTCKERKHLCTVCGKGFYTTTSLRIHTRIHTKERPFKCHICNRAFTQRGGLSTHMLKHTGYKAHKCDICSKHCTTRSDLRTHMRTHTKECPYKCEFCFKAFKTASNLLKHRRLHLNEREFKCDICGAAFNINDGLKRHVMTHTGERPHPCSVCGKSFISHSKLNKHKRVHTKEQPYSCTICSKKFGYSYSRNVHMRVQHNAYEKKDFLTPHVQKPKNIEGKMDIDTSILQINI